MTPEELMSLYAPFLICWSLIWLTNVSEQGGSAESASHHHTHHGQRDGKTHSTVPHDDDDREAKTDEKKWNVSNFFGIK
jgi:hypothetical protein